MTKKELRQDIRLIKQFIKEFKKRRDKETNEVLKSRYEYYIEVFKDDIEEIELDLNQNK